LIAHVLPFAGVGGTEVATLRLARASQKAGYRNLLLHLENVPVVEDWLKGIEIPCEPFLPAEPSIRRSLKWYSDSRSLASKLRQRGISLVHCADIGAINMIGLAAKLAGIPMVSHVRNRYEVLPSREQWLFRFVKRFVFVSQDTWKRFVANVEPERGTVLYDGITLKPVDVAVAAHRRAQLLAEHNLPPDARIFGMVARVAPQKDFKTLAEAARIAIADHRELYFLIVGEHSANDLQRTHFQQVRQWIAEAGLEKHFLFTGFRSDAIELLPTMDYFVLSTHFEGFPLVILEAMAAELPVIATAVDGIPEIVEEGVTGLLHNHEDARGLADQMIRLVRNPDESRRLAVAGFERVRDRFSQQAYEASVAQFYGELLGKPALY
jgi:glycosyltransferase involved in cell wall biosynthesis